MNPRFRFLCQAEARRLLLIMVITVALILLVQYFELPYGKVISSLFSSGNASSFPTGESSPKSEMVGNTTRSNDVNSTHAVHGTSNDAEAPTVMKGIAQGNKSKEKDRGPNNYNVSESNGGSDDAFGLISNGISPDGPVKLNRSFTLENGKNLDTGHSPEKSIAPEGPEQDTSFRNVTKNNNSSFSSIPVEDIALTVGKNAGSDAGFASPPLNLSFNTTFPTNTTLGASMTSTNSNISSLDKSAVDKLDSDGKPGLLQSNYSSSGYDSSTNGVPAVNKKKSKGPPSIVISISKMNDLLRLSHTSSHSMTPQWPSKVDQEVLFAKSQIENAPILKNYEGLYAPLYRNVSMFKRSYQIMESMLKVYIYQEGEKPIFHQSILEGIYASEGWFMKLLETNKKFVTEDPGNAHLFYFPFSSRLLELTLYARNSHNRSNLIEYMKNYVDMIATKHPFWNRTGGADHFLAACHDWAPAETRGRMLNCIRALCNADIEGGFSIGKDVSLPETYVHSAQNPLKSLGGNPPSQRPILAFFAGSMHGYVRPILLNYWENKDPNIKIFGPMPRVKGSANYIELMQTSKYCICAKGHEVNSPRVVEAIFYECVPVIISDNFVPPFFEVLNWESFAIFISEKDIPNLKNILLSISEEKYTEMHKRVKKLQQHFLWHNESVKYDLFHMILHSIWFNRVFE